MKANIMKSEKKVSIAPYRLITNVNNDYSLTDNGYSVKTQSSFGEPKSYKIVNDAGDTVGAFWGSSTEIFVDARGRVLRNIADTVILTAGARNISLTDGGNIAIGVGAGNLEITGLPTTNPGGSNRVWNDGGTLKIT